MRRRGAVGALLAWGLLLAALLWLPAARAQSIDVKTLQLHRDDGALSLDFAADLKIARPVEEALVRGVPVHFVAEASVMRPRWYWRDERVARVSRTWRLSYQPLTSTWRVSLGGLSQSFATADEALQTVARLTRWRLADAAALDPDESYIVDFSYRLDTTQLPRPMQLGLGTLTEWQMDLERRLPVK